MNRTLLRVQLLRHEALRLKPYTDTVGKLTIGVGRDLTDAGISEVEAWFLLDNDIARIDDALTRLVSVYSSLDDIRQRVLCDMAFNLGVAGLLGFHAMLGALAAGDFKAAAAAILDSKAAKQTGGRYLELAAMMAEGKDP